MKAKERHSRAGIAASMRALRESAGALYAKEQTPAKAWLAQVAEKGEGAGAEIAAGAVDKLGEGRPAWLSDRDAWNVMMSAARAGLPLFGAASKTDGYRAMLGPIYKAAAEVALMRLSVTSGRDCRGAVDAEGRVMDTNALWVACALFGEDVDASERAVLRELIRICERAEMEAEPPL